MPRSTPWSTTSAACHPDPHDAAALRLDWRPSRWVMAALIVLSVLAPFAALHSDAPRAMAWPLAATAAAWGLWSALREACRPDRCLALGARGGASLDRHPLAVATFQWRGPLLFLHWRDTAGQGGRLAWWPDTLPPAKRRELRLAAGMAT